MDRLVEHDFFHSTRLLEQARSSSDEALDRAVRPGLVVHAFEGPEPDVRSMLDRLIFTKEVWTAAIAGQEAPASRPTGVAEMQARLATVQPQLSSLVRRIRDRNEWDDAFVDALLAAGELHVRQRDRAYPRRVDRASPPHHAGAA